MENTPPGYTVQDLVQEAVQLAAEGLLGESDIAERTREKIRAVFNEQEQSEKFQLVSTALIEHPVWQQRFSKVEREPLNAQGKQSAPPVSHDDFLAITARLQEVLQACESLQAENQRLKRTPSMPPLQLSSEAVSMPRYKVPDPEPFDGDRKDYQRLKI